MMDDWAVLAFVSALAIGICSFAAIHHVVFCLEIATIMEDVKEAIAERFKEYLIARFIEKVSDGLRKM